MTTTTNPIKKFYLRAKEEVADIEARRNNMERQYMINKGITNNGVTPEYLWCIDDEGVFNAANLEFYELYEKNGLQDEANKARANLFRAEEAIVQLATHIAPPELAFYLIKCAAINATARQRLIEITLEHL